MVTPGQQSKSWMPKQNRRRGLNTPSSQREAFVDDIEVQIEIRGKVSIPRDDFARIEAEGPGELATILIRNGHDVKARVSEVYIKEPVKGR